MAKETSLSRFSRYCETYYLGTDSLEHAIDYVIKVLGDDLGVDVYDSSNVSSLLELLDKDMAKYLFYFCVQQRSGLKVEDFEELEQEMEIHCQFKSDEFDKIQKCGSFYEFFMWCMAQFLLDMGVKKDKDGNFIMGCDSVAIEEVKLACIDNYKSELLGDEHSILTYLSEYVKKVLPNGRIYNMSSNKSVINIVE